MVIEEVKLVSGAELLKTKEELLNKSTVRYRVLEKYGRTRHREGVYVYRYRKFTSIDYFPPVVEFLTWIDRVRNNNAIL